MPNGEAKTITQASAFKIGIMIFAAGAVVSEFRIMQRDNVVAATRADKRYERQQVLIEEIQDEVHGLIRCEP